MNPSSQSPLQNLFEELELLDTQMRASLTDPTHMENLLARRSRLICDVAAMVHALRPPTPADEAALLRSQRAGAESLRQLLLARHLLANELAHVQQTARLVDEIGRQSAPPQDRIILDA